MYSVKVGHDDIQSVELRDDDFRATKTNGYGGVKKSYGYFNVERYGESRLYMYEASNSYIIIKLKDGEHIFLNGKSVEITQNI